MAYVYYSGDFSWKSSLLEILYFVKRRLKLEAMRHRATRLFKTFELSETVLGSGLLQQQKTTVSYMLIIKPSLVHSASCRGVAGGLCVAFIRK